MYECPSIFGLCRRVAEEGYHLVEVGDFAHGDVGLDVDGLRLRFGYPAKGFELPVVEAGGSAVAVEVYGGWRDSVEGGEGANCGPPSGYISLRIPFSTPIFQSRQIHTSPFSLPVPHLVSKRLRRCGHPGIP